MAAQLVEAEKVSNVCSRGRFLFALRVAVVSFRFGLDVLVKRNLLSVAVTGTNCLCQFVLMDPEVKTASVLPAFLVIDGAPHFAEFCKKGTKNG